LTGLSGDERISTIGLAVLTQHQRVTDGRTNGIVVSIARLVYMNECGSTLKIVQNQGHAIAEVYEINKQINTHVDL